MKSMSESTASDPPSLKAQPRMKLFNGEFRFRYILPMLGIVSLLALAFILQSVNKFPILKSQDILTEGVIIFAAILYIFAVVSNAVLAVGTLIKAKDETSAIKWASLLVFISSIFYCSYRAHFLLTPLTVGAFANCNAEVVVVHLSFETMRFSLAIFYTLRVDVSFSGSSLALPDSLMTGLKVFVGASYMTMIVVWGFTMRGVTHGAICIPNRDAIALIMFFVVDAIVCGILLYCFLDRLAHTRKLYRQSALDRIKQIYTKHAFLSVLAIISTWIFTFVGLVIGIEFILVPIDVFCNALCVYLMFSFNGSLYKSCCEIPCIYGGCYNKDKPPAWLQDEIDARSSSNKNKPIAHLEEDNSARVTSVSGFHVSSDLGTPRASGGLRTTQSST